MKGIVFTEFFEMVEQKYGYQMVDGLIASTSLPSNGIYTSVGTYNHTEIVDLLVSLNKKTNEPLPMLLREFGKYLFNTFSKTYGYVINGAPDAFSLLSSIHNHIHLEVQKLYPDAELPHFKIERIDEKTLIMHYTSIRKMSDLAHGLIEGCLTHYGEKATITQQATNDDGSQTQFLIIKN
jgi:hypothetical protein